MNDLTAAVRLLEAHAAERRAIEEAQRATEALSRALNAPKGFRLSLLGWRARQ